MMTTRALVALGAALTCTRVPASAAAASGTAADLQHLVIFMQQNRAFDHYLGTLRGVRGFADRAAVPLRNGLNALYQPTTNASGGAPDFPRLRLPLAQGGSGAPPFQLPYRSPLATTSAGCGAAPLMIYGPDFGFAGIGDIGIVNGGRFDSWHTARPIGQGSAFFARADLPYYFALFDAFVVGDQSFASALSMTNPNLLHLFSGSSGWSVGENAPLDNTEPVPGFTWETIGETLEKGGVSWRVYQETDNFDDNGFAWFAKFQQSRPGDILFDKGVAVAPDALAALAADVASGRLPQVSIVIAPTNVSEHAPFSPALGERYTADLLAIFQANPAVYASTAVLLMYDEGGQFFDHAHTPLPPLSPPRDGASTLEPGSDALEATSTAVGGTLPVGMGFRVPLAIFSPWTRGGQVYSQVVDHVSPILLIERLFNVTCPNISPWRRAVSGDLLGAFDFSRPDYSWPPLPPLAPARQVFAEFSAQCSGNPAPRAPAPAEQAFPTQEPGTRPSRALPYTFLVSDALARGAGGSFTFSLTIRNTGAAGAAFLLLDALHLVAQPARNFAVEAGKAVTDVPQVLLPSGASRYAFSLHGPNGFVRQFAGDAAQASAADLACAMTYDAAGGNVVLQLAAGTSAAATFTVSDNAYGLVGSPWTVPVPAGGTVAFPVAVCGAAVGCWYDLSVSEAPAMAASGFQRRFMGRMETGADSISDPAMSAGVSPNAGRPLTGIAPLVPAEAPLFRASLITSPSPPSAGPGGGSPAMGSAAAQPPPPLAAIVAGTLIGAAAAAVAVAQVAKRLRRGGGGSGGGLGGGKRPIRSAVQQQQQQHQQRRGRGRGSDGVGEVVEGSKV